MRMRSANGQLVAHPRRCVQFPAVRISHGWTASPRSSSFSAPFVTSGSSYVLGAFEGKNTVAAPAGGRAVFASRVRPGRGTKAARMVARITETINARTGSGARSW